jgi:hypothetical protein
MKTGKSLMELAAELERQFQSKKDYTVGAQRLNMGVDKSTNQVILNGVNGGMPLKPIAHQQLASTLQIPKPYYDRMKETDPELLAHNVNTWLQRTPAKDRKLVRTMDGEVRALLSDSYRPLDNMELAMSVIPIMKETESRIESTDVTDSRLYIKAVSERVRGEVVVGDVVQAGMVISNSEVGLGSLSVQYLDFRLVCLNGMIRERAIRKAHLGRTARGVDQIEDAQEYFRDETRALNDAAFFSSVGDVVRGMFDKERFERRLRQYAGIAEIEIADPVATIELTSKKFGFNEEERKAVFANFVRGGMSNGWGLANAITRTAQDLPSYDRSTEFEKFGGDVIELKESDWKVLTPSAKA